MSKLSFETCIQAILDNIEIRKTVNYGDRTSVRQYNQAYDKITKKITYIETHYPDRINEFIALIHHPDPEVAYSCGCRVIYNRNFPMEARRSALAVVKKLFAEGQAKDVPAVAIPVLLEEWEILLADGDK